jgi:type II restriction enzyme
MLERKLAEPEVTRLFKDIEDFIRVAQSLLQRRKGRAGLSFQNHFQDILTEEKIPYDAQPDIEGLPDFVIPSVEAYKDKSFPLDRLLILGLKTTCKDRWRQVLEEGPRVRRKHIVTLQQGISVSQLLKMKKSNVSLVVPKDYHNNYDVGASGIELFSVAQFISSTREKFY